ncbi:MAG: hypothetical protein JSW61_13545 [Candidatus Thorarchaeota archaeon]|nr:MAG: hypothetical protein JSW61_13545 [Candidatus Thorarchaeota archaeon]
MEFSDIREFESDTSGGKLKFRMMDLENGALVLITDSPAFKLGLSAVAIPPGQGRNEPTSSGLFTMGLGSTLVRTIAEKVAAYLNKTCMIVVHVAQMDRAVMVDIISALKSNLVE